MAIPAKPTLTAPPTAPVRGEDRASFATKANAYVVFIGTNVTDLTAAIDWQNTVFTAVESEAADAAQSAVDAAAEVALAADQVTLAEDQVALAADQVALAADQVALAADEVALADAAAAAAVVTSNASAWVSGVSYSVNANAISGIDFGTYRAILTHTGVATDPSADPTNWVKISAPAKASQAEAEAGTENTKFLTSLRAAEAIAVQAISGLLPISKVSITSGVSQVDVALPAGENDLIITGRAITSATSVTVQITTSIDGITYANTSGAYKVNGTDSSRVLISTPAATRHQFTMTVVGSNDSGAFFSVYGNSSPGDETHSFEALRVVAQAITHIRFTAETGNFTGGEIIISQIQEVS